MQSTSIRRLTPLFLLFCCCPVFAQTTNQEVDSHVKFEVASLRFMTPDELARAGDNLDPDLATKCRVSNQGKMTVYLYTDFANTIAPRGNLVRKTDSGLIWILNSSGKQSLRSPGFSPLSSGSWITLFEGDTVEWECGEISTATEEIHAKTVFVKLGDKKEVVEVFSSFYTVPEEEVTRWNCLVRGSRELIPIKYCLQRRSDRRDYFVNRPYLTDHLFILLEC